MKSVRLYWRECILAVLVAANLVVFSLARAEGETDLLRVYFLDIGQGDSIFIDSPTHGRVLVDGGPNGKVLSELGKILPFGDRRIDVVIESHPDADHITGLVDVLKNYQVGVFMEPGVETSTNKVHVTLEGEVQSLNIKKIIAKRGMTIDLGAGVVMTILFPNQDVRDWETNDASIVAKLTYGSESFLLTGDSPKKVEYILLSLDKNILKSTVLKVGHHGSKNSTSLIYAEAVAPEYAVISAGAGNRYGHPSKEALDVLNQVGAKIVSTIDMGTIEFDTDGETLYLK
ncbi:MBL fold metallo-hydrolase [Candidatus Parcubacteria bacterium]|nr:MBL fold metallo-hydrolase [Candidatus Parcubacteria bacterium]